MVYRDDWPDLLTGMDVTDLNPSAVQAAVRQVRDYLGWHLAPSYDEVVTVEGPGWWRLETRLITAVASVTDADTGITVLDIRFDGGRVWARYDKTYRRAAIDFSHGYTVCPPDVVDFIRDFVKAGHGYRQVAQASVGQTNVTYREPSFEMLDAYRLPLI